ncbi:unnamed protein product (macronuclear) [Paramecium tetraurelia]|uniref:Transmembrane protein n=1 Tax=Paramecium tetraurelia TaxID=5888 RepID=A0D4L2_PARTE|nr:uncharacterized protein GSPATT00039256001 [Paramecium tetraurelia]CAK77979.1 unnamed protein product [Paramecium tetraurelia]|eukprot:XP_001445376.1 hypothetical protein (macronuclear) [Paramecium tetraurelia strain d4-2]
MQQSQNYKKKNIQEGNFNTSLYDKKQYYQRALLQLKKFRWLTQIIDIHKMNEYNNDESMNNHCKCKIKFKLFLITTVRIIKRQERKLIMKS